MAIEKNSFKVARFDTEYHSPNSKDKDTRMLSDDSLRRNSISVVESDGEDDDEYDDRDSGAGSDDFDLLELGETGEEFCQVGAQTCSIPFELYDLPGLKDVLSLDVWNEVLTEEERFGLAKYLPDMDQENFVRTLKELFSGDNLHFGNPVAKLFDMLKGGLCEPRVALYRQGSDFFKLRKYYHHLRKHQNAMVNNVCQIRDTWVNYKGYSIEEKIQVLNIMKSQKSLMNENMEELKSDSSDREESGDDLWGKKVDPKLDLKTGQYSGYSTGVMSDMSSRGRKTDMESAKYGKQNPRGTLKLSGPRATSMKEVVDPFISPNHGVEIKLGRYDFGLPPLQYTNQLSHDSPIAVRMKEHGKIVEDADDQEMMYEVAVHRDQNYLGVGAKNKHGAFKHGKKQEYPTTEADIDSFMRLPISARNDALGRNKTINQLSDIKVLTAKPSNSRNIYDGGEKIKYNEHLQQFTPENFKLGKVQKMRLSSRGSETELVGEGDPAWFNKKLGGVLPADLSYNPSESTKNKKWKMVREAVDPNVNNKLLHADYRLKTSKDNFRANSLQNERREMLGNRGIRMFTGGEDAESDSSERMDEDENPLMRSKWAYPGGVQDLRYGPNTKNTKLSKREKKDSYVTVDRSGCSSRKMEDYGHNLEMMRAEQKGKLHDVGYLNILPSKDLGEVAFPGSGGSHQKFYQLGRNGHSEVYRGESFHMPSLNTPLIPQKRLKSDFNRGFGVPPPNNMHDSNFDDESFWSQPLAANYGVPLKLGKKGQMAELPARRYPERSDLPLMGCNTIPKKRKAKNDSTLMDMLDNSNYLHADGQLLDDISPPRKHGKDKVEDAPDGLGNGFSEPPIMEMETEDEAEIKPQKKHLPLITPTVHTGFSFSIIHLLSAVRVAMITLRPDDHLAAENKNDKSDSGEGVKEEQDKKHEDKPSMDVNSSMPSAQANVPSLTVLEIVDRVKSSPGDPCILETQEPLQDLVRGVLKIFSSRTAPLGAKGWKPLVVYEKSTKSWSWIGPVSHNLSDTEAVEEVTSADAWGLPLKMLVKLVDCFANWLKNSQETLQQIGTLPAPPSELMQNNLDEKERFKDLKAQKSLSTISTSSEEVRAYFRKEEVLRYLIPDRAFSYTAIDGKKSIVAPLRRCGGKPTSKARDHFMLKRDRPPHVTILCLVRDAAARLPGSIGTRADVCTLIRDSQYIVEDVSDAQVNQVVSGALDRLHYERDPCVQFDGERKLWVYLHREREEEDFEDDGTSSTKKWRRQKKETTEPSDQGDVTVAYPGPVEQLKFDMVSDLSVETLCAEDDKRSEPDYHNSNDHVEENAETSHGSDPGMHHGPTPVIWNVLGLNPVEQESLACEENSTHEDFDEDAFDEDPPS